MTTKTIREYMDQLDEISRRDFLKGASAAAVAGALPDISKAETPEEERQRVVAYFRSVRSLVNPLIDFDKTQTTPNLIADVVVIVDPNGNIVDISTSDKSEWGSSIVRAFSKLKRLPTQGLDGLPPTGNLSNGQRRLHFRFTPQQVYGTSESVGEGDEQLEETSPEAIAKIGNLTRHR
jgi:hypothetical protein